MTPSSPSRTGSEAEPLQGIVLSSFAFALLHLAIPSFVTHLPIGLYFCYLRHRSGSVWPRVYAHATYKGADVLLHYL